MKYYFPFVTERKEATADQGIEQMFNTVLRGEKIIVYTDPHLAKEHAERMLIDDDDDGILCLDDTNIIFVVSTLRRPQYRLYLSGKLKEHFHIM